MAVPTITDVSPATGLSVGHTLVEITGTNFRTRTVAYEIPQAIEGPTVQVLFGGVEAEAWAQSPTSILALTPRYLGSAELDAFLAVDVVVKNLDDGGLPIAGELATSAAAFTYERAVLALPAAEPPLLQVLRALVHAIKRTVCKNVTTQTHPDYADDGATYTILADTPVFAIDKVGLPKDREWNQWDNEPVVHDGQLWNAPQTHMLVADFVLADEHENVAYRMHDALLELVRKQPYLYVPGDARWSSDPNEYPLEMSQDADQASSAGRGAIFSFSGQLRVRGIPLIPTEPICNIYTMLTFVLAMSNMTGSTFQAHES